MSGQLALAKDANEFLKMLTTIQNDGTDVQRSSLLVYFKELAEQAKSFVNEMPEGNNKTLLGVTTKTKLKEVFTAITNNKKNNREIKWENKLTELIDHRSSIKGQFDIAFRLFQGNYKNIYALELGQKQVNDPWKKKEDDEPWHKQVNRMGGRRK